MTRNVGSVDGWLRVIVGLVLLALVFVLEGGARWLGLIGLVPLITGIAGTCPAYSLLGIRTCKVEHRSA